MHLVTRNSQGPPIRNVAIELHPARPRCQRTLRERISLVVHFWIQCINRPTTAIAASTTEPTSTSTTTTSVPTLTTDDLNPRASLPSATNASTTFDSTTTTTSNTTSSLNIADNPDAPDSVTIVGIFTIATSPSAV
nr:unnamed protein product [Spirometra erinaceieuropaei]